MPSWPFSQAHAHTSPKLLCAGCKCLALWRWQMVCACIWDFSQREPGWPLKLLRFSNLGRMSRAHRWRTVGKCQKIRVQVHVIFSHYTTLSSLLSLIEPGFQIYNMEMMPMVTRLRELFWVANELIWVTTSPRGWLLWESFSFSHPNLTKKGCLKQSLQHCEESQPASAISLTGRENRQWSFCLTPPQAFIFLYHREGIERCTCSQISPKKLHNSSVGWQGLCWVSLRTELGWNVAGAIIEKWFSRIKEEKEDGFFSYLKAKPPRLVLAKLPSRHISRRNTLIPSLSFHSFHALTRLRFSWLPELAKLAALAKHRLEHSQNRDSDIKCYGNILLSEKKIKIEFDLLTLIL